MKKNVLYNEEKVNNKVRDAFKTLAEPVAMTLGPGGKNVILRNNAGGPTITKDGVTVADNISVQDEEEDLIISIIKEAASNANREAGDGTTSATVLAAEVWKEGAKLIASGHRPVDLQREVFSGIRKVAQKLDESATKFDLIDSTTRLEILTKIATISMNGEREVARLVAEAVGTMGPDGAITVQNSKKHRNTWERQEGVKINRGWTTPVFCSEDDKNRIILENPYVLITSHKLVGPQQLADLGGEQCLGGLVSSRRPILIIATEVGGSFLASLIANHKNGTFISCPILPPYFGIVRREFFNDLATLTGGRVIDADEGDQLAGVKLAHLGQAERIEITKNETIIVGGKGDPTKIEERRKALRNRLDGSKEAELDKIKERLAKLSGGVGIIELVTNSDIELEEKKHRVEDAAGACRAALEQGYVPGGGAELYRAALAVLDEVVAGEKVLLRSCENLISRMAENIGRYGPIVLETLKKSNPGTTVELRSGELKDALESGVIDPVKVVKSSLLNGAGIGAALLMTGAIISDIPENNKNSFLEPYN